jgi:hypothetical protein
MNVPPNREVALFSAALELDASQRAAYLDEACADDPALRQRLEELLRVHEEAITFLESRAPAVQGSPTGAEVPDATIRVSISPVEKAGDRIGRYKLLQQIGEGGWVADFRTGGRTTNLRSASPIAGWLGAHTRANLSSHLFVPLALISAD